jgi:hypothetical protein
MARLIARRTVINSDRRFASSARAETDGFRDHTGLSRLCYGQSRGLFQLEQTRPVGELGLVKGASIAMNDAQRYLRNVAECLSAAELVGHRSEPVRSCPLTI